MDSAEVTWLPKKEDGSTHLGVFIGVAIGLAITLVLVFVNSKGWFGYRERIKHAFTNPFFVVSLIAALLLYFAVFAVANAIKPAPVAEQKGLWPSLFYHLEVNPGGWFAVVTGIATLCGLAFALEQLWEMRRAIRSFAELIDRIEDLAKSATPDNPLRIVAYTPAVGYLAQPNEDWLRFKAAVARHAGAGEPTSQIVCLKQQDLATWHNRFVGRVTLRGKLTSTDCTSATTAAEGLATALQQNAQYGAAAATNVCRLPSDFLPGYYLFFTKRRALIVVPLFFPLPIPNPPPTGLADFNERLPTVQMIGFETTDRAYIKDFELMFQRYFELNGKV